MDKPGHHTNQIPEPIITRLKKKLLKWIRLSNDPVVRVYNSYGNSKQLMVFGHVLRLSPVPRKKYTRNIWINSFALIRLFMVKPYPKVQVEMQFGDHKMVGKTEDDGFFRFSWTSSSDIPPGWHRVKVRLVNIIAGESREISGEGLVYVPFVNQYAFISDIDDTFLISHSSSIRKRLFVLLTENAHSRQPFEGVVRHYKLLAGAATTVEEPNPFFYVSSSEWNLYDYIVEFSVKNELPRGIYMLNQLKQLSEAWRTGHNKHATKFTRIVRIMETYPSHQFILLGDDSQQDPEIYSSIVNHFPQQVKAVYLRHIHKRNADMVKNAIQRIEAAGVKCCHFEHSREAIQHSISIGLIR